MDKVVEDMFVKDFFKKLSFYDCEFIIEVLFVKLKWMRYGKIGFDGRELKRRNYYDSNY